MKFELHQLDWLATELKQDINSYQLLSDSHTGSVYLIYYGNGYKAVCKHDHTFVPVYNRDKTTDTSVLVSSERKSLSFFKQNTVLAIPEVIATYGPSLILNYIEQEDLPNRSELAAYDISNLHAQSHKSFGFGENNYIAGVLQTNEWNSSWVDFYAEQRLIPTLNLLKDKELIGDRFFDRMQNFCSKLDNYIPNKPKPSLLHGDLWAGNILSSRNKKLVYIDPAPYFGHFEIEIAFLLMFQTFNQDFYSIYNGFSRLDNEFYSLRAAIYQMYPNLIHAYLYDDASYIQPIHKTLEKLGY